MFYSILSTQIVSLDKIEYRLYLQKSIFQNTHLTTATIARRLVGRIARLFVLELLHHLRRKHVFGGRILALHMACQLHRQAAKAWVWPQER